MAEDFKMPTTLKDVPCITTNSARTKSDTGGEKINVKPCGCHFNVTTNTQVYCSYQHYVED